MENPIKMDDLGVPLFLETPRCFYVFEPCPGTISSINSTAILQGVALQALMAAL